MLYNKSLLEKLNKQIIIDNNTKDRFVTLYILNLTVNIHRNNIEIMLHTGLLLQMFKFILFDS